jgi:lycopene beta-cyclase
VPGAIEPPSFLYLLPLSRQRVFLEETSLAHRPGVAPALLRTRLQARLRALRLENASVVSEEHCAIPMGLGLPTPGQRLVPFGAAAAMVHPASGYSIAHVLRKAEPVADAIVRGLAGGSATDAASSANQVVWPRPQRTVWELYAFGLETLVDMSTEETARFFDAFFSMPISAWSGFLGGTLGPSELGAVMTRLFRSLPAPLRWHLVRTSVRAGAAPLARTVIQPGLT